MSVNPPEHFEVGTTSSKDERGEEFRVVCVCLVWCKGGRGGRGDALYRMSTNQMA